MSVVTAKNKGVSGLILPPVAAATFELGCKHNLTLVPITPFVNRIICGDALQILKRLPPESIDCVVTSPPYWRLRDYNVQGQLGQETSVDRYIHRLCGVFDEIKRALKETGTCWVNLGDTYATDSPVRFASAERFARVSPRSRRSLRESHGIPRKSLLQIPSRFALEMTARGWTLRNEIIWHKPNPMPESVRDRFTVDFEKMFFFVKSRHYYFHQQYEPLRDQRSVLRAHPRRRTNTKKQTFGEREASSFNPKTEEASRLRMLKLGRNKRCVWRVTTRAFRGNHFAVYPPALVETPIKAGCPKGGIVLDPFMGSGTTAIVARSLGRKFIGIDLNPEYVEMARKAVAQGVLF